MDCAKRLLKDPYLKEAQRVGIHLIAVEVKITFRKPPTNCDNHKILTPALDYPFYYLKMFLQPIHL